jgi:hypothetical protein
LPPSLKWKTAFLYQDQSRPALVSIYSDEALRYLAFGDPSARRSFGEAYVALLALRLAGIDIFQFSKNEWARWKTFQGSVQGLIASDGNEWKESVRAALEHSKQAVIWWSKRPSGKSLVATQLKKLVNAKGQFPFYFTRNGKVTHRARVVDIAFADDYEVKKSGWANAESYEQDFEDYADDARSAAVAFLIDEMTRLDGSLTPNDFDYWGTFSAPTQDNLQPFVSVRATSEEAEDTSAGANDIALPSKNVIFYGPPGTGKTYFIRSELFDRFTKMSAGKSRDRWLVEEADNLSWWKVVAAALLSGGPSSVPVLAEHEIVRAKIATTHQASPRAMIWAMLQQHTYEDCEFVHYANRVDPQLFRKDANSVWSVDGAAMKEIIPEVADFVAKGTNYSDDQHSSERNYEFITFHQSMTYEDFIEGIKPTLGEGIEKQGLSYEVKEGIFKQICRRARLSPGTAFALFIDEINRGNVAGIFGELISLIEEDKREGAPAELRAMLPYSRDSFTVPRNLYVIGTMNSADRSVEALDSALRRRFSFVEILPKPELLQAIEGIDLSKLLSTINRRLEGLRDRDHRIGHAYLMGISSLDSLRAAFTDRIIPLLQEYFYGDWSKIPMVLGSRFAKVSAVKVTWPNGYEGEGEAAAGDSWSITDPTTWDVEAFLSIYA